MNPTIDTTLLTVGGLYVEACQDLCAAYDVHLTLADGTPKDFVLGKGCYKSVLTLTADTIRLTSVLIIEAPLLVATHAARTPLWTPVDLADWCREFSNQLGGRLKNKLLPVGIEVRMGLAALVSEDDDLPSDIPVTDVQHCAFSSDKGWLRGELSMHLAPDFKPVEVPGVVQGDALLEGTFLMF